MCLAQGPQRSDAGEARICGPLVSCQALYHWATALPPRNWSFIILLTGLAFITAFAFISTLQNVIFIKICLLVIICDIPVSEIIWKLVTISDRGDQSLVTLTCEYYYLNMAAFRWHHSTTTGLECKMQTPKGRRRFVLLFDRVFFENFLFLARK